MIPAMSPARPWRRIAPGLAAAVAALACTAPAASAAAPAVTTGGAAVGPTTATFTGTVDPQGRSTTYYFEYGTTSAFGAQTPPVRAGSGNAAVTAAASVANLADFTVYHYRLVATNRDGTQPGARRTVRTQRAPLGLSLSAAPNPIPFGAVATIGGSLTGTGSAGRQVQLFQNPFPYTGGFQPVGAPAGTNAAGAFAIPIGTPTVTTQYRARLIGEPAAQSEILTVPVALNVSTAVGVGPRRSDGVRMVRFAGRIRPGRIGALYGIQRKSGARWVTVAGGVVRPEDAVSSRYAKHVRVRHSGTYRVYVQISNGDVVSGAGREVPIKLRPVR
jgi:hypothetical protein